MRIGYTKRTEETKERLYDLMPYDLREEKIFLNIGNTKSKEEKYKNYLILNPNYAVKNSANKKRMFKLFRENKINSIRFINLNFLGKIKAIGYLSIGKDLVLREKGLNVFGFSQLIKFLKSQNYVTIKENKVLEYRIIVFRNKILRIMIKLPKEDEFTLKQENCKFIGVTLNIEQKNKDNIINSVKCLGLDLAGVDVLVNERGNMKIIEVNSGMSLSTKSINLVYDEIRELI